MKKDLSIREFRVVSTEDGFEPEKYTLDELMSEDGMEITYSLQEIFDDILSLGVNESLVFKPLRDNAKENGIILRIK